MRFNFLIIFLFLISACASLGPASGPAFKPTNINETNNAVLYVYRPDVEFNREGSPEIFLNGEKKALLRAGGYLSFIVPPGEYEIKAEGSTWGTNWWPRLASRTLSVEAGNEYYVRIVPTLPPNVKAGTHLFNENNVSRTIIKLIQPEEAQKEITNTMLSQ